MSEIWRRIRRAEASAGIHDTTDDSITHGLLMRKESLDGILGGMKTWEIRGAATRRRGPIALIESGTGNVAGTCVLADVLGPLPMTHLAIDPQSLFGRPNPLHFAAAYAWVLSEGRRLAEPIPYRHPDGAVVWVELDLPVCEQLLQLS